ncbi:restriction endonuclease subunit S [Tenacibaculum maritimum]|uniref:restriction endonuclease subunit S n=1 Tax=Tenacibaculum maritimum TaxID=107401 RepID=UPI003876161D
MEVLLKDISKVSAGNSAPKKDDFSNEGIPFVRAGSLAFLTSGRSIDECEKVTKSIASKKRLKLFKKDSILFAKSGMSSKMGRIYQLEEDAYVVSHLAVIEVDKLIANPSYIKYFFVLRPPFFLIRDEAYPSIKLEDIKNISLILPDLPTQNKIVAILDKVSALVQKRENSIALLRELISAQFLEMFGDPVLNPKKYSLSTLENLCHFITKGTTPKAKEIHKEPFENSVPYLKVYNLSEDGSIDFHHNPSYVSQEIHSNLLKRSKVYPNDILMNIVGPPLGKVGIVDSSFPEWNVNQAIVIFRCKESISPIYLLATLKSKNLLDDIMRKAVGVRQLNISLKVCRNIVIPVAPIELQNQFITIHYKIESQKETLMKSKNQLENLYNSLLQRAFNGQLNFNVDIELDALLATIDLEQDAEKKKHDIKEITTVYAGRLLERIEEQKFETQIQYKQAKEVIFQMLREGILGQEYDEVSKSIKLNLV